MSILDADVILPCQYFESVGTRTLSSEQRLMLAVLIDAINVLQGYQVSPYGYRRDPFNEASSWIFTKDDTSLLSFDRVCDSLGFDAENLRSRLSKLVSGHGSNLPRLKLKEMGRRIAPAITRVRRRRRMEVSP